MRYYWHTLLSAAVIVCSIIRETITYAATSIYFYVHRLFDSAIPLEWRPQRLLEAPPLVIGREQHRAFLARLLDRTPAHLHRPDWSAALAA